MERKYTKNQPTGLELFLYWWRVTERSGIPSLSTSFRLKDYDLEFRKWASYWVLRRSYYNFCSQISRRTLISNMTENSMVRYIGNDGVVISDKGYILVHDWLHEQPKNINNSTPVAAPIPVSRRAKKSEGEQTVIYKPDRLHPVGTQEMISTVAENYRRLTPVGSFTDGFRDGALWVLGMDRATLDYLRGELKNGE